MFSEKFDVRSFCRDVLGVDLVDPQVEALDNVRKNKKSITVGCRGFGKDMLIALTVLSAAMTNPDTKIGVFSSSFRFSRGVFQEINKIYKKSSLLPYCTKSQPVLGNNQCNLVFNNGSSVQSFPVDDGSHLKGYRCNILLVNEACHMPEDVFNIVLRPLVCYNKDPMKLMEAEMLKQVTEKTDLMSEQVKRLALNDIITHLQKEERKSKVALFTTANYTDNWVYHLINSGEYATRMFSYVDLPLAFIDRAGIGQARRDMSKEMFAMEYDSKWIDARCWVM